MAQIKRDLTVGSIPKTLISFCFPVFLSALLQAFYGSADAIIVGQFSSLGDISGVTQGSQVMNIVTQGISGISVGACVLIGQYLGAKRQKDMEETICTVFSLFLFSGLFLMAVLLMLNRSFALLLHLSEEAAGPFCNYMRICELGIVFIFIYNCIASVLQALGDSRHPLIFVGIACTLNIILDLVLIKGFRLGASGAAAATVVSQFVSVILSLVFLKKQNFPFDFKLSSFHIVKDKAIKILKLGVPYAVQRVLVYTSFTAISGLANMFGLVFGSAAGIVAKINSFATIPFSAFNAGVSSVVSQCYGKNNIERARKTMLTGVLLCLSCGGFLFVVCQFFPRAVLSIFTSNEELIDIAIPFLMCYSLEYILMPFTWPIHGMYSGCGHTIIPAIDGILASVVFRTPLALLCSKTFGFGYKGIALGAALAVLGAIVPAWTIYFSGIWRRKRLFVKDSSDEKKV